MSSISYRATSTKQGLIAVIFHCMQTYTSVTGTFTVPSPSVPSGSGSSGSGYSSHHFGGGGSYSAAAWVGIDGDTCSTAILQTGVDFTVTESGDVSYDGTFYSHGKHYDFILICPIILSALTAWYEWLPDAAHDFKGISFSAGDSVTLTVTANSTTSGTAVIENTSTGQIVTKALTSTSPLCETNAEWIVEDYEEGDELVPLADFGTVVFTNAQASTVGGESVGPDGATIIDMVDQTGENTVATAEADSSSVTVTYQ